jgi:hypothetical protein
MRILKDENLVTSPIRSAMAYAWAAISGNWKNSVLVALALLVLSLLAMLPLIGVVASVIQGILFYALAYWFVDRVRESDSVEAFRTRMAGEEARTILAGYFGPGAGFYTGFVVISLIMMALTVLILWLSGGFAAIEVAATQMQADPNASPEQMTAVYAQVMGASMPALAFMLITSLFFSYVWPLVYGYGLLQKSFVDAFNSVFMLFSPRFWKATFTGRYFVLVSLWMLVLLGAGFLLGITFATFILIPVGILLMMWMVYFSATVGVAAYNMSDDI